MSVTVTSRRAIRETAEGAAGADSAPATPSVWERLRAPFPPDRIGRLPKPTKRDNPRGACRECGKWHGLPAVHLDYVSHADVTDRLLAVDAMWNWEPLALDDDGLPRFVRGKQGQPIGLWIRLTVCGVTRLGYGSVEPDAFDPEKQLIGDALRNAAMRFGVALDLWRKDEPVATTEHTESAQQTPGQQTPGNGTPRVPVTRVTKRAAVEGRGCPDCGADLESVEFSNGGGVISCTHWRQRDGGCRYREQRRDDSGAGDRAEHVEALRRVIAHDLTPEARATLFREFSYGGGDISQWLSARADLATVRDRALELDELLDAERMAETV